MSIDKNLGYDPVAHAENMQWLKEREAQRLQQGEALRLLDSIEHFARALLKQSDPSATATGTHVIADAILTNVAALRTRPVGAAPADGKREPLWHSGTEELPAREEVIAVHGPTFSIGYKHQFNALDLSIDAWCTRRALIESARNLRTDTTATSSPAAQRDVNEVGLNLLRQLVGRKNALRTLGVFPCNNAEHLNVDCACFWEQCEAWAKQDAEGEQDDLT